MKHRVYVALGSNIGDREQYLNTAIEKLIKEESVEVTKLSSMYETEPVGVTDQSPFLNMVIELYTTLQPVELLTVTQRIEQELKRERKERWGPRTIDLDILLFNDENIRMNDLMIPHPRMHERAFVLVPLKEIAPAVVCPSIRKNIHELTNHLSVQEKEGVRLWKSCSGRETFGHSES